MKDYLKEINEKGFTIMRSFFTEAYCIKINESIDKAYNICREVQIRNEISDVTDGTLHHLILTGESIFLNLLEKLSEPPIFDFLFNFFQGNYILNTYGAVKNLKSKPSYVANIHRDIRFYTGEFPLMIQLLIILDDFTEENGATYLLPGSHKSPEKPSDNFFYENSERALGKRGDIIFFNSNLWHCAGINKTDQERRGITIAFTKPFMKQQLDYSRALGYENVENMNDKLKQILGFRARIPSSLDEWYQKTENRFYKPDQDKMN